MKQRSILAAIALLAATALAASAAPTPPPVNQYLGIPDTIFNNMTEAACRSCHNQSPPITAVDKTYLPDRHHLLVDTTIPALTDVPYPDANGDGVKETTYVCYSCHRSTYNTTTGTYTLDPNFRDCTLCHKQTGTTGGTVHHRATLAQSGDCAACHGSFVDKGLLDTDKDKIIDALDPDVDGDGILNQVDPSTIPGGWIPTYQGSLVTPWPSKKPASGPANGTDDRLSNAFGEKQGSCKFCHSNLSGVNGEYTVEDTGPFKPVKVYTNYDTHHNTGFIEDPTKCLWCHAADQPVGSPLKTAPAIRTCEICHGIPSLHTIQVDSGTDGIKPGAEVKGFGHIGAQWDCDGCHGFDSTTTTATAAPSGPVVPALYYLSASSVQAGSAIELTGTAFISQIQNPMDGSYMAQTSNVLLTNAAGNQIVLAPVNIFNDAIQVVIPADLPAGNYKIAAKKFSSLSNPLNLAVTPKPSVASAAASGSVVTISGSGFAACIDAAGSTTNVTATITTVNSSKRNPGTTTQTVQGVIKSWTDTQIVVSFAAAPSAVTVNTLFGSVANVPVSGATTPPPSGGNPGKGNKKG